MLEGQIPTMYKPHLRMIFQINEPIPMSSHNSHAFHWNAALAGAGLHGPVAEKISALGPWGNQSIAITSGGDCSAHKSGPLP
jgi:hypothetical protein